MEHMKQNQDSIDTSKIRPLDEEALKKSQMRWNAIAHPLHSLGKLEDVVIKLAGIYRTDVVPKTKKALVIMCADNGVVAEGVTQTGQEVTAIVAENFLKENATAAIFCKETHADIFPIDIGIARDTNIICKKIAYGTKNMTKEPAMTRKEAVLAIQTGIDFVLELKQKGYNLIATGEMGIGNTTTSSAVTSVLLKEDPIHMTGRGAGLSDDGLKKKINAIQTAIALHQPDEKDVIDVLSKVGGFDLCGLCGVFLGGAIYQIPIILDGFISSTAALCAAKMHANAKYYMIASHISKEPAAVLLLKTLELDPVLHADMSLGEGTGAVAFFPFIDLAIRVYQTMSTFEENDIESYKEQAAL